MIIPRLQLPPLSVIKSWPAPNYTDPETRGHGNLVITLILFPLAVAIILVRCYTRIWLLNNFGWDDGLAMASLFPIAAFTTISLLAEIHYGWNRHVWDFPLDQITLGVKFALISQVLFAISVTLTKLSMLALTYRLVANISPTHARLISSVFAFTAVTCVGFNLILFLQCRHPWDYWTLSSMPQNCISETKHLLAAGIINILTDVAVVILPIPSVWKLQVPRPQQIMVVLLFGSGFFVIFAGAVRTYYLYEVTVSWDRTWAAWPVWVSSSAELYIGVICASLPTTKQFFSLTLRNLQASSVFTWLFSCPTIKVSAGNTSEATRSTYRQLDVPLQDIRRDPFSVTIPLDTDNSALQLNAKTQVRASNMSLQSGLKVVS